MREAIVEERRPARFLRVGGVLMLVACAGCARSTDPSAVARRTDRVDVSRVLAALDDPSASRRARAVRALGRTQSPEFADALARVAGDAEIEVRSAALFALGQYGLARGVEPPPAAVEACRAALADAEPTVVGRGVEALGKLAPPGFEERAVGLLDHEAADVREAAATALFRMRFAPVWRGATVEDSPWSPAAVEALVGALGDEEPGVRRAAAHAFSRYGEPTAARALERSLDDDDEWVRLFAVRAAGGSSADGSAVAAALDDPSARVRQAAVLALDALDAIDRLPLDLVGDPSFHVRAALATALGRAESAGSLSSLRSLARDGRPTVRGAAIDALARRLGDGHAAALEAWLAADDWRMRVAAVRAARHLSRPAAWIEAGLADADVRVRTAALEQWEGREPVPPDALAALAHPDTALRGTAIGVIAASEHPHKLERFTETFGASVGVEWIEIRETLVDAVADLDGAEPLLRRAATDGAVSVRTRARRALRGRGIELPPDPPPADVPAAWLEPPPAEAPTVMLETTQGTIAVRCMPGQAPLHTESFLRLVRQGFYDGLSWHRVVSDFVIQGGDPRGDGWGGPGYVLPDEIGVERFARGALGMPKAGRDTGGCQLFVTHVPTPHLDGNYTLFGRVVSGLEVVDRIEVGDRIVRARVEP